MSLGTEWVVDAGGCDAEALADIDRLKLVFERIIHDLELRVLGDISWHKFPEPGGITGIALLSESHLTCHTYPEFGAASFNLYCCRNRTTWAWGRMLREMLGATEVNIRVLERLSYTNETKLEEIGQWAS
ncbi:MAG TPA: S-adenosylmethionine decarboxylase [Pyrinomonadaceae bacterium]|nr:S-adenosylmethionine decarboxylase [Pyrinomonadaceae bacterium]